MAPAFARKASLAVAEQQRDPAGLRMGETRGFTETENDEFGDIFYASRLSLDMPSDDEEKIGTGRKGRANWTSTLGWESAPPTKGKVLLPEHREKMRRKHRHKRVMRELDNDLDAFNAYAQNGFTPLTRSLNGSIRAPGSTTGNLHASISSFPSFLDTDAASYLPDQPRPVLFGDGFDALDIMADHIFRIGVQKKKWFKPPRMGQKRDEVGTGLTLRVKTGLFRTFPVDYDLLDEFEEAMIRLNPEVAIKINSQIVATIMRTYM